MEERRHGSGVALDVRPFFLPLRARLLAALAMLRCFVAHTTPPSFFQQSLKVG
jgi:hypothetical protein